jgi:hypothetical protein
MPTKPTSVAKPQAAKLFRWSQTPTSQPTFVSDNVRHAWNQDSGIGFDPREIIRFKFYDTEIGKPTLSNANGSFEAVSVQIPPDWTHAGSVNITATGDMSKRASSEAFEIPPATIELSSNSVPSPRKIEVKGAGFSVGDNVTLCALKSKADPCESGKPGLLGRETANEEGAFSTTIDIGDSCTVPYPPGKYFFLATAVTGGRSASQQLEVTGKASTCP